MNQSNSPASIQRERERERYGEIGGVLRFKRLNKKEFAC